MKYRTVRLKINAREHERAAPAYTCTQTSSRAGGNIYGRRLLLVHGGGQHHATPEIKEGNAWRWIAILEECMKALCWQWGTLKPARRLFVAVSECLFQKIVNYFDIRMELKTRRLPQSFFQHRQKYHRNPASFQQTGQRLGGANAWRRCITLRRSRAVGAARLASTACMM